MLAVFAVFVVPATVRAAPRNAYGKAGRTILSTSAYGSRSNVSYADPFGHDTTWSTVLHFTALHFVADNLALGGTFEGGLQNLRQFHESPSSRWLALDVDAAYQLPLSARLSLRFWVWAGLRAARTRQVSYERDGDRVTAVPDASSRPLSIALGVAPSLLIHLSSSVALDLGPKLTVFLPLRENQSPRVALQAGVSMTYAFGPEPETQQRMQDARGFGARGRNLMSAFLVASSGITGAVSYARFVRQGLGVGGYLNAGGLVENGEFWAGAGVQLVGSVPIAGALNALFVPSLGYGLHGTSDSGTPTSATHELIGVLSTYLGVHLYDGLFVGLGPRVSTHVRLGSFGLAGPNPYYVEGGVGSALLASF